MENKFALLKPFGREVNIAQRWDIPISGLAGELLPATSANQKHAFVRNNLLVMLPGNNI